MKMLARKFVLLFIKLVSMYMTVKEILHNSRLVTSVEVTHLEFVPSHTTQIPDHKNRT